LGNNVDLGLQSGFGTGAWLLRPETGQNPLFGSGRLTPGADYSAVASFGTGVSIVGAAMSAIGTFYSLRAQQNQLESQASALEFQAEMSQIDARAAEEQAYSVLESGRYDIIRRTLAAGQELGARKARIGSRGVRSGVGSAAEEIASANLAKELDVMAINSNTLAAAEAGFVRAQSFRTQAAVQRGSAANTRASARSISPGLAAGTSLLTSAGNIATNYAQYRRRFY